MTMHNSLLVALVERAGYRCAWCARKLDTGRRADRSVVCTLDDSGEPTKMVAACSACNAEFQYWKRFAAWSVQAAVQCFNRALGTLSAPFVDYLVSATGGDPWSFEAAIGRIEAQRNAELGLVGKSRTA